MKNFHRNCRVSFKGNGSNRIIIILFNNMPNQGGSFFLNYCLDIANSFSWDLGASYNQIGLIFIYFIFIFLL